MNTPGKARDTAEQVPIGGGDDTSDGAGRNTLTGRTAYGKRRRKLLRVFFLKKKKKFPLLDLFFFFIFLLDFLRITRRKKK